MAQQSSIKYSRLSIEDERPNEDTRIDFSSPFQYGGMKEADYKSIHKFYSTNKNQTLNDRITVVRAGKKQLAMYEQVLYAAIRVILMFLVVITFPFTGWFAIKWIKEHEQAVISSLGFSKIIKGPSVQFLIPLVDRIKRLDTRPKAFFIPPFRVMTRDMTLVEVGGRVQYEIQDAEKACFSVADLDKSMRHTAQVTVARYLETLLTKEVDNQARCNIDLKFVVYNVLQTMGIAVTKFDLSDMKVILKMEQPPAIDAVLEPLKDMFFGNHDNPDNFIVNPLMVNPEIKPYAKIQSLDLSALNDYTPDEPAQGDDVPEAVPPSGVISPDILLTAVSTVCDKALVRSIDCVYKFIITDHSPSTYYLDLKYGEGSCGIGDPPSKNPDTTIEISQSNMSALFLGKLSPVNAYMSGQLSIDGDTDGAMKLGELLSRLASLVPATQS